MNLLTGKIKPLYLKYLGAAFGSACISSVYGLVDMAMVGQYHGPSGTAAMSVVMPIFNIIYSLGLFMGIGGSVLYSSEKGRRENGCCNEFFPRRSWAQPPLPRLLGLVLFSLESLCFGCLARNKHFCH